MGRHWQRQCEQQGQTGRGRKMFAFSSVLEMHWKNYTVVLFLLATQTETRIIEASGMVMISSVSSPTLTV